MQDKTLSNLLESAIGKRVVAVVCKKFRVQEGFNANANFIDDFGADSIDVVELIMALEEEFGIEIPSEAAEEIRSVEQAILYIENV